MTEEEKLKLLWEIAHEVAKEDPTYETGMGDVECFYCNGESDYQEHKFKHEDACIVIKARALVKEKGNT